MSFPRPITFSPGMVRAILDGRKTQTRRVIKPQLEPVAAGAGTEWRLGPDPAASVFTPDMLVAHAADITPYGQTGLRWVTEAWRTSRKFDGIWPRNLPEKAQIFFEADARLHGEPPARARAHYGQLRNARFLPRRFSRLTLNITRVTIERVRDISEADAIAEGLLGLTKDGKTVKYGLPDLDGLPGNDDVGQHWEDWHRDPRLAYRSIWDRVNARRGFEWEANPWVAVIHFTPIARNIHDLIGERAA